MQLLISMHIYFIYFLSDGVLSFLVNFWAVTIKSIAHDDEWSSFSTSRVNAERKAWKAMKGHHTFIQFVETTTRENRLLNSYISARYSIRSSGSSKAPKKINVEFVDDCHFPRQPQALSGGEATIKCCDESIVSTWKPPEARNARLETPLTLCYGFWLHEFNIDK